MTGINPNQILYRQPNIIGQPAYGDINAAIGLDDRTVASVKDNMKDGVVGKTLVDVAEGSKKKSRWEWIKEKATLIGLGSVVTLGLDKVSNLFARGEKSYLVRTVEAIDKFAENNSILNFKWLRRAYDATLGRSELVKSMAKAPAESPRFKYAAPQLVTSSKQKALAEFLSEAAEHAGKGKTNKQVEVLNKILNGGMRELRSAGKLPKLENVNISQIEQKAYDVAVKLSKEKGEIPKHLQILANKATAAMKAKTPISKLLVSAFNTASRFFSWGGVVKSLKSLKGKAGLAATGGAAIAALGGLAMHLFMGIIPFGEMAKSTMDAPKGEKKSTFAHSLLVDFVAGWLMMDVMAGLFYKGLGALKGAKGNNFLSRSAAWILNKAGQLASVGLNTPKTVRPTTSLGWATFPLRKSWELLKRGSGFIGRFGFVAMVMMPLAGKIMAPICYKLFGRPNALLEKEKAEEGKGKDSENNNIEELKKALAENRNSGMLTVDSKNANVINPLIQNRLQEQSQNLANNPSQEDLLAGASLKLGDVRPELNKIPSEEQDIAANKLDRQVKVKPQYTYVPSDAKKPSDDKNNQIEDQQRKAKFNAALAQTDRMIEEAQKSLRS